MQKRAAVFIDRDGTLIEDKDHLASVAEIEIFPNSCEAVRKINSAGLLAVVITNQSAVARGLLTELQLQEIHRVLTEAFAQEGATLDAIYYCPHHPDEGSGPFTRTCKCRKPEAGMLINAARDCGIDLSRSVLIGDTLSDVEAGHRAGTRSVLVQTGYGKESAATLSGSAESIKPEQLPDHIAPDILAAVSWLLDARTSVEDRPSEISK